MWVVLGVAALAIYAIADRFLDLPPTALQFRSERVEAIPAGSQVRIIGEYSFEAQHPRKRTYEIGFPTHMGSGLPPPQAVAVMVDGRSIPFKTLSQGLSFIMPVTPSGQTRLRIEYTMAAPEHKATYITHTALLWPEPIRTAEFVIPNGVKSNYHKPGETSVTFEDFRPKENWEMEWR